MVPNGKMYHDCCRNVNSKVDVWQTGNIMRDRIVKC